MWETIPEIVNEIKKCEAAHAMTAAISMCYICIDTMSFLALPIERETQTRQDFIEWVEKYLKGHPDQTYKYNGLDLYGARCSVLHTYSSETQLHSKNPNMKKLIYHDGGRHMMDDTIEKNLVIIGTASFINDIAHAVSSFMEECRSNDGLRVCVESRLDKIFLMTPIKEL